MTPNPNRKAAALQLLTKGHATMAELAPFASVSRQAVRLWAQEAGIDPVATRNARLRTMWAKALAEVRTRSSK
jgi:hypothetical protein